MLTTMNAPVESGHASHTHTAPSARRARALDDLLELSHEELAALYADGVVPRVETISGDLRGRMLAVPALSDAVTSLPRAWARSRSFPWRGKSFWPVTEGRGEGKNRVVSDRWMLFRFTTFIAPSHDRDGRDAMQLDYDHADNPFFIRAIEDEIREIGDGLYLGQAWLRVRGKKHFVLWFALEARR
jgi:hypothetical protein